MFKAKAGKKNLINLKVDPSGEAERKSEGGPRRGQKYYYWILIYNLKIKFQCRKTFFKDGIRLLEV